MQGQSYFKRFNEYISGRGHENTRQMDLVKELDHLDSDDDEAKQIEKTKQK